MYNDSEIIINRISAYLKQMINKLIDVITEANDVL